MRVSSVWFFFSSRSRHTRLVSDWSSDVCSSDLIAGTVPPLRDALLPVIRGASALALAILVVVALVSGFPALRPETAIAAVALLAAGALVASLVAALLGGEPRAIVLGGGTRDFAIAATLAVRTGGDAAAAVPLAYGALLFAALAVVVVARRMRPNA